MGQIVNIEKTNFQRNGCACTTKWFAQNESKELRLKAKPLQYQCIDCQQWVEENGAAMSKEGVMCLDCYTLARKRKTELDKNDNSPATLARLHPAKP
jgi:hypothetical protein